MDTWQNPSNLLNCLIEVTGGERDLFIVGVRATSSEIAEERSREELEYLFEAIDNYTCHTDVTHSVVELEYGQADLAEATREILETSLVECDE